MKIQRLLGLLSILGEVDKITVQELAERFEVSKRTIFRDLETLSCAGIPIVSYPGLGGGVAIIKEYKLDKKILTENDSEKLLTALNGLKSIDNDSDVTNLTAKLVPGQESDFLTESPYVIDLSSWFQDSLTREKTAALHRAILDRRLVRMDYIGKTSRSIRTVEPHKLLFRQSYWYLYGFCLKQGDFRLFRLNRIASFELLETQFQFRPVKTPEFKTDFGKDLLSFQAKKGWFEVVLEYDLSCEFDLTQKIDAFFLHPLVSSNGEGRSTDHGEIRFYTADLSYAADSVIGLLDKVRVISPPELFAEIQKRINKINCFYKG
ncbi:transcriptional regulator [Clostridium sp. chh4-2]|uniref:helix-turn-helix transcriptional regulator n=1 Tax=Clostridium sp. chh4-2 TaxID=2067550 RepID=UPI000CCF2B57|nr:YafY family protein [Clostridium sp. chh4-2]PNV59772.1 transcriptional regulator [Clostridium sp. chh4-2]